MAIEPHFLLSNRVVWYPQNPVSDYATGTLRVTVPVRLPRDRQRRAGGRRHNVVTLRDWCRRAGGVPFMFRADQPLRYLGVAVSRFVKRRRTQGDRGHGAPGTDIDTVTVAVETQPRLQGRGRQLAAQAQNIMAFYSSLVGEAPFPAMTIGAGRERNARAATAPATSRCSTTRCRTRTCRGAATRRRSTASPSSSSPTSWRTSGGARRVGWKNYHEQWLSEGFAQYFAALWAQRSRGDRVFTDMLRQFRRWSLSESDQGPVHLGYRLGHIKRDLRVYRAIVYNKGAAVLHMLRRLVGDEAFFAGLRRFYDDRRFQKAGTDDFERAMEDETGRTLDRFFERWIYGTGIPRVAYHAAVSGNVANLTFEQPGDKVFDLPVTVTLTRHRRPDPRVRRRADRGRR